MNLKERREEGMDRVMAMTEIRTCAAQSKSQGGVICVVKGGRLVEVLPDPDHPNGPHEVDLDPKSRVLPELLYHSEWLKRPVRWSRLGGHLWDEALESIAQKLLTIQEESGPEAVDFHRALPGAPLQAITTPGFTGWPSPSEVRTPPPRYTSATGTRTLRPVTATGAGSPSPTSTGRGRSSWGPGAGRTRSLRFTMIPMICILAIL